MSNQDQPLLIGASFEDRYEILAKLGEGGFGAVYKARQRTTGQLVALKVMRLPDAGGEAQAEKRAARFLREARLSADLHHPNIVQLLDTGRSKGGSLYSVFSFAPGDDLAAVLAREGALAPREARHLMLEVLDALACAHAAGVIHRDLKPSNILVVQSGARRNALVLDFGIGAIVDPPATLGATTAVDPSAEPPPPRLTGSHDALGTPGYGAPEQWRGVEPSARADLFSWGLVFLECLVGEPVYRGTAAEIFYQLLGSDPVPIPPALDGHPLGDLIRSATRKDVAAREVTALGLFAALEACDLRDLPREALRGLVGAEASGRKDATSTLSLDDTGPRPTAERRQVTALCCHVALPADAAGEEQDDALRASLATASTVARRHRGRVVAGLGHDLLVYFGYPRAEEDDALRAGRAALAIAEAVPAGVGLHTGMVLAGDAGSADVSTGMTPRLAARLATRAAPGSVVVTAAAQSLLRGAFELDGADGGTETFHLRRERATHTPGPTAEGPLVGRAQEISLLTERWRRAPAGAGSASLITGEPGIGKSRLVQELRRQTSADAPVFLEARCSPDTQNNGLFPVVELLGRALGLDQEADIVARTRRLEEKLGDLGIALPEAMPIFLPLFSLPIAAPYAPLDVSPPRLKALTLTAAVSLLSSMAERHPLLLVVEDLHWADPTTNELLAQLVREGPSFPMCVLLTARPEYSPSFSTMGMLQLPLGRLSRPEVEALVTDLMGKKAVPAEVLDQVVSRTEGVPLFVEELTRMMTDSGVLVERGDHYDLAGRLADLEMPGTLRALLTARLDRMGRAKETAQVAAALGREFSVEVLSAVSPLAAGEVQEDLDRLADAGLVLRKRRTRDPVGVFKHALVRDAAYESLSRGARREVHGRIAGVMEERFPEVVRGRPDLLAYHHAAAEQKAQAIGYAERAATTALESSAYVEVIAHTRDALDWLGAVTDDHQRWEAELRLNGIVTPALMATRGYGAPEVESVVQRSQTLIDTLGDGPHTFTTLWALWGYHELRGDHAIALAQAQRSLALTEHGEDLGQRVVALIQVGHSLFFYGRFDEARAHFERALTLYDPMAHRHHTLLFSQDSKVFALGFLAMTLFFLGHPDQAVARAQEGVDWATELKHPNSLGMAMYYRACVRQYRREPAEVMAATDALLQIANKHGLQLWMVAGTILRSWAERDTERPTQILAGLQAMGVGQVLPYFMSILAESAASQGKFDVAVDLLDTCLRIAAEKHEHFYVPELYRLKGTLLLQRGGDGTEEAATCFRTAIDLARSQSARMLELRAALALHQLLAQRRSREAADVGLASLSREFAEGFELRELREARALFPATINQ
jgi:TOMM system kinase/cyclase fusion protein